MHEYVVYTEQEDKHTKQDEHYVSARVCFRIRGAFLLLLFAVSPSLSLDGGTAHAAAENVLFGI